MDLIKQAREMGKMIQASEEYAKLKKAQEAGALLAKEMRRKYGD